MNKFGDRLFTVSAAMVAAFCQDHAYREAILSELPEGVTLVVGRPDPFTPSPEGLQKFFIPVETFKEPPMLETIDDRKVPHWERRNNRPFYASVPRKKR